MKEYIEERAVAIANYIIDYNATVRQAARKFGISKSTVHTVVPRRNILFGLFDKSKKGAETLIVEVSTPALFYLK